jgi:hypothetical protein
MLASKMAVEDLSPSSLFLAYAFVDQNIGVDSGADRQHEACDTRQGQRRVEDGHDPQDHEGVYDQRDRRVDAEAAVGDQHEKDHRGGRHDARDRPLADRILAQFRADRPLLDHLQRDGQLA